jgi:CDP-diacylglycerol---glycerol-3-phosphate 3-phosphatidyltransferase
MRRNLPNQLTLIRLALAGVFFLVLNLYRYQPNSADDAEWALVFCFVTFIIAAITDWLDGYLARKWKAESTFGRIMDPFCDKVLVIGSFIYLSGPRFVDTFHAGDERGFFNVVPGNMITGVYPWMVVVILARELLVTGIRDELESAGVKFGASVFGKLKMLLQVICIPTVIAIVWLDPWQPGHEWMLWVRHIVVYATVICTALSGIPYVTNAYRTIRGGGEQH